MLVAALVTAALASDGFKSDNIKVYEPLHFDESVLYEDAGPTRYADGGARDDFSLEVKAFGRSYMLNLWHAGAFLTDDIKLEIPDRNGNVASVPFNTAGFYLGNVQGHAESHANLHVDDEGHVRAYFGVGDDTHYISPAFEHFDRDQEFRHIVYREADMAWNGTETQAARKAEISRPSPAAEAVRSTIRGRRGVAGDTIFQGPYNAADDTCHTAIYIDANFVDEYGGTGAEKEARAAAVATQRWLQAANVFKRQLPDPPNPAEDRSDPGPQCTGNSGSVVDVNAIKIQAAVFRFEDSADVGTGFDKIPKALSSIEHTDSSSSGTPNDGGKLYLEYFSRLDWSKYCLAHAFVHTDFNGLLGLAWTAFTDGSGFNGGICTARYNKNSQTRESLNTAFHSSLNFGTKQPELQSALVMVHELAHNFGSGHDSETPPSGSGGTYLMYPYASDGTKENNQLLSPESLHDICEVIRDRGACFIPSDSAICGNGVTEGDEECDCGSAEQCPDLDPCCNVYSDGSSNNCKLKTSPPSGVLNWDSNKKCTLAPEDPVDGLCCSDTCQVVDSASTCEEESPCTKARVCGSTTDGGSLGECQPAENVDDGDPCDPLIQQSSSLCDTTNCAGLCFSGECSKEVCADVFSAEPCGSGKDACDVRCSTDGGNTCTAVGTSPFINANYTTAIRKRKGSACEFNAGEPTSGVCTDSGCQLADGERTAFDELLEIYGQLVEFFSEWLNRESAGLPNYGWIIIGVVLVIGLCILGCYFANKRKKEVEG